MDLDLGNHWEHSYGCVTQMLLSMQKLSKLKFSIEWSIGSSARLVWTKGWDSLQNKWG